MNLAWEMNADSIDPMWVVYSPVNKGYTKVKLSKKMAIGEIRDTILDLICQVQMKYPMHIRKSFLQCVR